jgi:hypothetical protein
VYFTLRRNAFFIAIDDAIDHGPPKKIPAFGFLTELV